MNAAPGLRLTLLFTLLLAFALRVMWLGAQELRGDEAFGYFLSLKSPSQIIDATLELGEPHPIASYIVEHIWLQLAGDSEFALRFTSAWCGVLAVALTHRLARFLTFPPWGAWLAALLLAISPYAVWHSQDARMYSMILALTLAMVYLALEALQRRRWQWSSAYIAVAWLALHTHYYAFFVLAALTLFIVGRAIVTPGARSALGAWLRWNALLALLYLPWLMSAGGLLSDYRGNGDSPALVEALQRGLGVFAVGESVPSEQRVFWTLLAVALLALGAARLAAGGSQTRRALWLLLCYLFVPVLLTWWSAVSRPIFNERYLVAASPAFYLLLAAAASPLSLHRLVRWDRAMRRVGLAGLIVLCMAAILSLARYTMDSTYSKTRGWRELAAAITRLSAGLPPAQTRIAQNFPDPTLWYYYRGPLHHAVLPPAPHDEIGAQRLVEEFLRAGVERVILPVQPAPNWDHEGLAAITLSTVYDLAYQAQVGVWPLQVYAGFPALDTSQTVGHTFVNGVEIVGIGGLEHAALVPGGLLAPTLLWSGIGEQIGGVKMTLQILGPDGALIAQHDRALVETRPANGVMRVRTYGIVLPDHLDSGAHRLILALYNPDAPGAPRIPVVDGGDAVLLKEFTVGK